MAGYLIYLLSVIFLWALMHCIDGISTVLGISSNKSQRFNASLRMRFEKKKKERGDWREKKRKAREEKEQIELVRKRGVVSVEAVIELEIRRKTRTTPKGEGGHEGGFGEGRMRGLQAVGISGFFKDTGRLPVCHDNWKD